MDEPTDVTDSGRAPGPARAGKPVVLVPYYSAIEKECEAGLRALVSAGVALSRFSLSAIDLLRSAMLSHALREGYDSMLFIDADIGFDPADALRILARPEPVVAGVYVHNKGRDFAGTFARGVTRVVFGPGAPGLYPMLYAPTGFLRSPGGSAPSHDRRAQASGMPLGGDQGNLSVFPAAVRARRARGNAVSDRRLCLLASAEPDRNHADGRHDHQVVPLQKIRVQLRRPADSPSDRQFYGRDHLCGRGRSAVAAAAGRVNAISSHAETACADGEPRRLPGSAKPVPNQRD